MKSAKGWCRAVQGQSIDEFICVLKTFRTKIGGCHATHKPFFALTRAGKRLRGPSMGNRGLTYGGVRGTS